MAVPHVAATPLRRRVLAPAGSKLVLAEWVAQARVGEEPRSEAPLHAHEGDEAW